MQQFICPFCGPRDEREFRYAGQAGRRRPDTSGQVPDQEWSDYLYFRDNPCGPGREVWVHLPCQEYFEMTRDTRTMAVGDVVAQRRGAG